MFKTALILADGHGSRMRELAGDQPKHLLPLPNGQTVVGRLARELGPITDRLICTIREERFQESFRKSFAEAGVVADFIVVGESDLEYSSIRQVAEIVSQGNVIVTNGDLVFSDGIVADFVKKHGDQNFFVRGREGNPVNKKGLLDIFNSRISVVPYRILRDFSYASRFRAFWHLLVSLLYGRVEKIPTLFNVDTPEDYKRAVRYFERS